MKNYKICVIKGDGIGPEIIDEAIKVLDVVSAEFGIKFEYDYKLMGGAAYDVFGEPLPDETLSSALSSDAVLFGAIGGEKWDSLPRHLRPESGLLKIRKELEAYANLRPAIIFDELVDASTLKPEVLKGVDFVVVRELTGGLYFGQPREKAKIERLTRWFILNLRSNASQRSPLRRLCFARKRSAWSIRQMCLRQASFGAR